MSGLSHAKYSGVLCKKCGVLCKSEASAESTEASSAQSAEEFVEFGVKFLCNLCSFYSCVDHEKACLLYSMSAQLDQHT